MHSPHSFASIDRREFTWSCVTTERVCDLLRQRRPLINQHELLVVSLTELGLMDAPAQAISGGTASCRPEDGCIFCKCGLFMCSFTSDYAFCNTVSKVLLKGADSGSQFSPVVNRAQSSPVKCDPLSS